MRLLLSLFFILFSSPNVALAYDFKELRTYYLDSLQKRPIPLRDLTTLSHKIFSENRTFSTRDELLWLGIVASTLELAGDSQKLIDIVPKIPRDFRQQDYYSHTLITLAQCQYLKYHGDYRSCLDLVALLKPVTPAHSLQCEYCIVDLTLYKAMVTHASGDSKKALEQLDLFSQSNPRLTRNQKDWIECLKAQIEMDRGNSEAAYKKFQSLGRLLDKIEDGKLTGPVYKYYWQWVRLSLLIDLGKENDAEVPLIGLSRALADDVTGPTFLSAFIHLDLVKISILKKNNLKTQQLIDETTRIIKSTPDVDYLKDFVTVLKTSDTQARQRLLAQMKEKMGTNNPEVLKLERFVRKAFVK